MNETTQLLDKKQITICWHRYYAYGIEAKVKEEGLTFFFIMIVKVDEPFWLLDLSKVLKIDQNKSISLEIM